MECWVFYRQKEKMKITCDSCKGTWNADEKMGTKRNCPHCGKNGMVMTTCSKCGKIMMADTKFDSHAGKTMVNPFAAGTAIKCPKCKFLGHWSDFAIILDTRSSFLGMRF